MVMAVTDDDIDDDIGGGSGDDDYSAMMANQNYNDILEWKPNFTNSYPAIRAYD